tara:strand:- start:129 stop:338 length:210 start_codon:yes stop_codon:yes gene_type:complete
MSSEGSDELCGSFEYKRRYSRLLFWLIIFSCLACIQSFLIMTKITSKRTQDYFISTTAGRVKLVAKIQE